jgi:transcriptional regulator with XRE-family HTH domain
VESMDPVSFRSRLLGRLMRELREQAGLTMRYVAACLGADLALVRWFEHGDGSLARAQMAELLDVYREHDPQRREGLLRLAEAAWRSQAGPDFDGAMPDESFADLLWLEDEAHRIRYYSPTAIPDSLHTAEYAEQIARAVLGPSSLPEQVAARLAIAEQRRHIIHRQPEPVAIDVVLEECALRHAGRDRRVWSAQLDHLREIGRLPNVQIRMLPTNATRPPQVVGPFTVFTLPQPYPGTMVHIEYLGGRLFLENGDASDHLHAFDQLRQAAASMDPRARSIVAP